jgi:2-polyprenyl-6-methoxyphenol hydroxylase-like FAD-dependent oxidoreductase
MSPSILILGAGMAGLGVARALRIRDMPFDIIDRAHRETGTGIFLPANAVRALDELGVSGLGHPITRMRMLDQRGKRLLDLPFDTIWGDTGPCVAVDRTELHRALAEGVPVRYGVEYPAAVEGTYDLVIGADGIRSVVRGTPAPQPTGLVAWRFIAESEAPAGEWTAWQGHKRTFLAVSLGGGRAYCYADADAVPAGDWRELFADFTDPVPALTAQGADAHFGPIEEVEPVYTAGPGKVLIGDAAHAFSPNMAQGAALAFEDALVLAELLSTQPLDTAVRDFAARRLPRARWVRDNTHRRDKTRLLPPPIRNTLLRLAGERLVTANFRPLRDRP